jgi:hypothetical protein
MLLHIFINKAIMTERIQGEEKTLMQNIQIRLRIKKKRETKHLFCHNDATIFPKATEKRLGH